MQIVVDPELKPDDNAAIRNRLLAYNDAQVDSAEGHFGALLKDDAGETIGGLTAHWYYDWMFVELLFVPAHLRGQQLGTRLLREAEAHARELKLRGIWLDTFSFQARGFYEKLGYSVFGELPFYPATHTRHFLSKLL